MVKINLLRERKSIRNSLRPKPKRAKKTSLDKMRIIVSILFICIFVVYWYYPEDWANKPSGLLEKIARSEGNVVMPEREEKSSDLIDTAVEEPEPAQPETEQVKSVPVEPKKNAPVDKPHLEEKSEPAKTEIPELEIPEMVETKMEKPADGGKWHVRFGFCLQPSSCVAQQKSLAKKDIQARIVDGFVMLTRHKVVVGPWSTDTQAEKAKSKLSKIGVTVNMFLVGTNRYLATASVSNKKLAERIKEKIAEHKYRVSVSSKKEETAVGKVFLDKDFKDRKFAVAELNKFRKRGIDSVVERGQ